jgi:hypothetical protein
MNVRPWLGTTILVMLILSTVACAGNETEEAAPEIEGPALVMFYTDN